MIEINNELTATDLLPKIEQMWALSADKILSIEASCTPEFGTPVFTIDGRYSAQGWTEWTQGFQFGSAILQFDASRDEQFLEIGRRNTIDRMASHVSHFGVHDHGFNNVSTYGNLRRLMLEGAIQQNDAELAGYELALKVSGAVQASRWSETHDGGGYIYSFNGPHSLFCDTIRSLRSLAVAFQLGHSLMGENDLETSLLDRLIQHSLCTSQHNVYFGKGRDRYDIRGRVAHESIFNPNDGRYRCPSTQQGYSAFSTWTRGLSWIIAGYPEELEFLQTVEDDILQSHGGSEAIEAMMIETAEAACDFYLEYTPIDGIPYWDTGAPNLPQLGDYLARPAEPFNDHEPVDSSAAAIAAQGLLRLGHYLKKHSQRLKNDHGERYWQAGLTVLSRLLEEPYLSTASDHQGLLLHSIYHHPRSWDHVPSGSVMPSGESCMWGDYHLREAALYVQRIAKDETYYTFFGPES